MKCQGPLFLVGSDLNVFLSVKCPVVENLSTRVQALRTARKIKGLFAATDLSTCTTSIFGAAEAAEKVGYCKE